MARKEITVEAVFVQIDGIDYRMDSFTKERQKEIWGALNDKALRALGYTPVKEENNAKDI